MKDRSCTKLVPYLFILTFTITATQTTFAGGTPEDSGLGIHVDDNGIAAQGADVVAYFSLESGDPAVEGNVGHAFSWLGATWLFSSSATLNAFAADPAKYTPEYGGYCAWAMARDKLATVDPDRWDIVDGKLYLNYNRKTQNSWQDNQVEDIIRADELWPDQVRKLKN